MRAVSIIRERGQLTIPDTIRKAVSWVSPLSAVSIAVTEPDEIVIRPHQVKINWEKIWENIRKSRSISNKGTMSASEFLNQDRKSH